MVWVLPLTSRVNFWAMRAPPEILLDGQSLPVRMLRQTEQAVNCPDCRSRPRHGTVAPAMVSVAPATAPLPAAHPPSRWLAAARTGFPFVVVGVAWEIVAHWGVFPPRLFPPLEQVAATLV